MNRYWFKFDVNGYADIPMGLKMGCGVTAYNHEDALSILRTKVFKRYELPPVIESIEQVNISELDQRHVIPNMGIVTNRGVWFPMGYE